MCGSLTTATWFAIGGLERLGFLSHTLRQPGDMAGAVHTQATPRRRDGEKLAMALLVEGW